MRRILRIRMHPRKIDRILRIRWRKERATILTIKGGEKRWCLSARQVKTGQTRGMVRGGLANWAAGVRARIDFLRSTLLPLYVNIRCISDHTGYSRIELHVTSFLGVARVVSLMLSTAKAKKFDKH
jgi:hypothetical protein